MRPRIPAEEMDAYRCTCDEAIGLAMLDRVPAGYRSLYSGLERARRLAADGEAWAPELLLRYRATLRRYRRRWNPGLMH